MPENVRATSSQTNKEIREFRGKNRPRNEFVVIVTPQGTSFCYAASFEPLRMKVSRPVRSFDDIKKKKQTQKLQMHHIAEAKLRALGR
jgi:hypothetical protein